MDADPVGAGEPEWESHGLPQACGSVSIWAFIVAPRHSYVRCLKPKRATREFDVDALSHQSVVHEVFVCEQCQYDVSRKIVDPTVDESATCTSHENMQVEPAVTSASGCVQPSQTDPSVG